MEFIRRCLKNTRGFTLVEVLLALTIFTIGIIPIYQMIVSGAKMQNLAEETYQATLHSQALLQEVKKQIETDVAQDYQVSRQLSSKVIEPWLAPTEGTIDSSVINFLKIAEDQFNKKYDTKNYLYEVHIWPMENGKPVVDAISFTNCEDPVSVVGVTKAEIKDLIERYFQDNDSLIWAGLGGVKPIGIGEIKYMAPEAIEIRAQGIEGYDIVVGDIVGYGFLGKNIKLIYKRHDDGGGGPITHELIVEDIIASVAGDIIQLSIDLTTFPVGTNSKTIRIENKTKATVVVSAYNEKNEAGIQIYPIQQNKEGRIIVEDRAKLEPIKNFVIEIIVKDANNITFGEPHKVLGKIVDLYSFDYNNQ